MSALPHRALVSLGAICFFTCLALAADFRTDSNLVVVPVSVTDSGNHVITDLERRSFRVFDDKAEQKLVQFAREDAPVSVGIVFDLSGSMRDKLAKSREALDQFLRTANPEDEFFLVEFSNRASLTVPFTADSATIRNRLSHAEAQGRTALLDAVRLAMDTMRTAHHTRRALLILSDGGDNLSRYTESELRSRARESNIWIYSMGLYDPHTVMLPEESGAGQYLLETLARESGGRHHSVERPADLPAIAAQIGMELRNQYILGYQPSEPRRDGRYHHVLVKVVEDRQLTLSWRPGYYGQK